MTTSFDTAPDLYQYNISNQKEFDKLIKPLFTCTEKVTLAVKGHQFVHLQIVGKLFKRTFSNQEALKAELNYEIVQALHLGIASYEVNLEKLTHLSQRTDIDKRVITLLRNLFENSDKQVRLKAIKGVLVDLYHESHPKHSKEAFILGCLAQSLKDKDENSLLQWIEIALPLNHKDLVFEKKFLEILGSVDNTLLCKIQYLLLQQAILSKDSLTEKKYLEYGLYNNLSKFSGDEDFNKRCLDYCIKNKDDTLVLSHISHWESIYKDHIEISGFIAEILWMTEDYDKAIKIYDSIKEKLTVFEGRVRLALGFFIAGQYLVKRDYQKGLGFTGFASKLDPTKRTYEEYFVLAKDDSPTRPTDFSPKAKQKTNLFQSTTLEKLKDNLKKGELEVAAQLFLKLPNSGYHYSLDSKSLSQLGQAFIILGDRKMALECFKIALELNPLDDSNKFNSADLYLTIWNSKINSYAELTSGKLENLLFEELLLNDKSPLDHNAPIKNFAQFKLNCLIGHTYIELRNITKASEYFAKVRSTLDTIDAHHPDYQRLFGDPTLVLHLDQALDSLEGFCYTDLSLPLWMQKVNSLDSLTSDKRLEALLKKQALIKMGNTLEETHPSKVFAQYKISCRIGETYLELKNSAKARNYFATAYDIVDNIDLNSPEYAPLFMEEDFAIAKLLFSFGKLLWELNNEQDPYFDKMLELLELASSMAPPNNTEYSDFLNMIK